MAIRKRIGLAILVGGALVIALAVFLGGREVEPEPGPWASRSVPISTDTHPRLIFQAGSDPLATAMANARNDGRQEEIFATVEALTGTPVDRYEAASEAFAYRIRTDLGETGSDTSDYGSRALNYVCNSNASAGYVISNTPQTVWDACSSYSCKSGTHRWGLPVALVLDWTYDIANSTQRNRISQYLCEWSNIFYQYVMPGGTLADTDAGNFFLPNVATLGVMLMEITGKDTGTCTLSMNANTTIQTIANFYTANALNIGRPNGGFWFEGPHYEDVGFNASAIFLAAADTAGYIDITATQYANLMDYQIHESIEPDDRWFQYADSVLGDMDDYDQLHAFHALYMYAGGNKPEYYRLWDMVRAERETGGPWYVLGAEIPLYMAYFNATVPTGTPSALSQFLRDNPTGTPEPVGGILRARDNWGDTQMAWNFINRNTPFGHNHYDYSGLEITYGGERFVVDHSSNYNDLDHGKALEQNHAVFYDTTNAKWGWMPPNDQAVNTDDNASAYGYYPALVDYQPVGVAVYSDNRYSHISPIWYPPTTVPTSTVVSGYIPKATITPAPVGRRLVAFSRQSTLPPVLAVYDRNSLGSAEDWRVLWNTAYDLTITGSGTVASPLKLVHPNGPTLYAFASDGLSMGHYTRAYPCVVSNNCESAILQANGTEVYYTQQDAVVEPVFSTLWFPSPNGDPTITLEVLSSRNTYKIVFPGFSGYTRYVQNQARTGITIAGVTTDAEAFLLNYDAADDVIGGVFANYSTLQYNAATVDTGTTDVAVVEFNGSSAGGQASNSALASTAVASGPTWTPSPTPTRTPTRTRTPGPTSTSSPTASATPELTPQVCPSVAVTIDGSLSDWLTPGVTPVVVSGTPGAYTYNLDIDGTPSAVSGRFFCAYDADYFYIAGEITDGTVRTAPYSLESGDAVTVDVDGRANGSQSPGFDDHSYTVGVDGRVYDYMIYAPDVLADTSTSAPGWRFEMRVPAAELQDADETLEADQLLWMTYSIINRDTAWADGVTYDDIRVSYKYSVRLE